MDSAEDGMWWYRAIHARIGDALRRSPAARGGRVLDAGCGTGGGLRALAAALPGAALVGLEYDTEAAARAARKSGMPVTGGDLNHLPFADGSFDAALSVDVLCHRGVTEAAALAELHRVLAAGGTLVLNLPAFEWLRSAHDTRVHNARRYTAPGAARLLREAGFASVEARYWNSLLLPLMAVQRKLLNAHEDAASDVAPFPPWLDATLFAVDAAERRLAALGLRFPAGGSVLAVATRP
ncbi:class I SAM-dependent methyltransferase [Roseomonas sp. BN140053]|uniref:class I SAM-dependent methyltransferase n=1 Tax=Roseomonas sp. BN140053 TaxID=3391898 RepID=UPI0039EA3109